METMACVSPAPELVKKVRQSRTEAQREASRRNGARSRGPVTAAGKARSSINAVRHGFLASMDVFGKVVTERAMLQQLTDDVTASIHPRNPAEIELCGLFAWDLVHSVRIRQAINGCSAQALATYIRPAGDLPRLLAIRSLLELALADIQAERPFAFTEAEAQKIVVELREMVISALDRRDRRRKLEESRRQWCAQRGLEWGPELAERCPPEIFDRVMANSTFSDREQPAAESEEDEEGGGGEEQVAGVEQETVDEPTAADLFRARGARRAAPADPEDRFCAICDRLCFDRATGIRVLTGAVRPTPYVAQHLPELLERTAAAVDEQIDENHRAIDEECQKAPCAREGEEQTARLELYARYDTARLNSARRVVATIADLRRLQQME